MNKIKSFFQRTGQTSSREAAKQRLQLPSLFKLNAWWYGHLH